MVSPSLLTSGGIALKMFIVSPPCGKCCVVWVFLTELSARIGITSCGVVCISELSVDEDVNDDSDKAAHGITSFMHRGSVLGYKATPGVCLSS